MKLTITANLATKLFLTNSNIVNIKPFKYTFSDNVRSVQTNASILDHSSTLDESDSKEKKNVHPELDFHEEICSRLSNNQPFRIDELIVCKSITKIDWLDKVHTRLIKLKPNEIYRGIRFDILHEHIIDKSRRDLTKDVSFNLFSNSVTFSRPSLYEFNVLKEQAAVSSHYSIISMVPMLLEIGKNSRVLECGTGSGTMTLFLSERIGHSGLIHTFDIGRYKVEAAKEHFWRWKSHYDLSVGRDSEKWPSNVRFGVRDLCNEELSNDYTEFYDAIYLDMGDLDKAVLKAYKLLKLNGVLVMNALHLTQVMSVMNSVKKNRLGLENEIIMEPNNRLWEMRPIKTKSRSADIQSESDVLDWTCRLEDRFVEKYKRGGMFFNYWSGFLIKFRKTS